MALLAYDLRCYRKFSYLVWKISHCHAASNSWHLALDSLLLAAPFCVVSSISSSTPAHVGAMPAGGGEAGAASDCSGDAEAAASGSEPATAQSTGRGGGGAGVEGGRERKEGR
eukprot:766167-Hanusia_phi.AAC.2